jgi:hypothetical protein
MRYASLLRLRALSIPAGAVTTTFTDRAAWEAALGVPVQTLDFEDETPHEVSPTGEDAVYGLFTVEIGPNHGGVGVFEEDGNRFLQIDLHAGFDNDPIHEDPGAASDTYLFRPDHPLYAVGFDIDSSAFFLALSNDAGPDDPISIGPGFFGIIWTGPTWSHFDEFELFASSFDGLRGIDNLSVPVPEPATGMFLGLGLAVLALLRRR